MPIPVSVTTGKDTFQRFLTRSRLLRRGAGVYPDLMTCQPCSSCAQRARVGGAVLRGRNAWRPKTDLSELSGEVGDRRVRGLCVVTFDNGSPEHLVVR